MAKKIGNHQYEAMFLLGPIGAAEPENSLNMCRGIIERHGGEIMVIKKWDERKLTYEIGGQKRGTYIIAFFTAPGTAISAVERDVSLSEDILRVLVLKADHLSKEEMAAVEPQPIQPREERTYDRAPMGDMEGRPPRSFDRDRGPRPPRREEGAEAAVGKE